MELGVGNEPIPTSYPYWDLKHLSQTHLIVVLLEVTHRNFPDSGREAM